MASPRGYTGASRPLISPTGLSSPNGGGGIHRSYPSPSSSSSALSTSFRRFLRPTTGNMLMWIPIVALVCILVSIVHTQSQLEEHAERKGQSKRQDERR